MPVRRKPSFMAGFLSGDLSGRARQECFAPSIQGVQRLDAGGQGRLERAREGGRDTACATAGKAGMPETPGALLRG